MQTRIVPERATLQRFYELGVGQLTNIEKFTGPIAGAVTKTNSPTDELPDSLRPSSRNRYSCPIFEGEEGDEGEEFWTAHWFERGGAGRPCPMWRV